MQDPNTPNPSDEENGSTYASGSGHGSGDERPKLKLKKILTPLSPHLKEPRPERDPRVQKPASYRASPQAEPVEPEEPLHECPRAEPIPLDEIEPPRPEELNPHLPEEGMEPSGQEGEDGYPGEPPPEEETGAAGPEAVEEEEEAAPASPPEGASRRRILPFALGGVMLAAGAVLAIQLFRSFGEGTEPVQIANPVTERGNSPATGSEALPYSDLQPMELMVQIESESAEEYIARLKQEPIFPAREPRGIFIDQVFVPEGSSLNRRLGIHLTGIEFSDRETTIILQDSASNPYTIALNR